MRVRRADGELDPQHARRHAAAVSLAGVQHRGPDRAFTVDRYHAELGRELRDPLPVELFSDYGRWFQEQAVPDMDTRRVARISAASGSFRLELDDGERLSAERVVVATGIVPFAARPPQFDGLPPTLVSHAADHSDLRLFSGQRVAVVGGGQSALESAALLAEASADVELLVRAPDVHWLAAGEVKDGRSPRLYAYRRIRLGGSRSSWMVASPALFERFPERLQTDLTARCLRPAGAGWLRPRVAGLPLTTGCGVHAARAAGEHARLELEDGRTLEVDHVLLATGYRIDLARYSFLAPELVAGIESRGGFPVLGPGFESTVPGLHFLGAPAAGTFGPVMRFVCGTWASARGLTRGVVGRSAPRAGFSW